MNNFRDVGGRLTEDCTHRMRQGILYRGQQINSSAGKVFEKYGIVAEH